MLCSAEKGKYHHLMTHTHSDRRPDDSKDEGLSREELRRIIERDMPGWELSESPQEELPPVEPDAVSPSIEELKEKYFPDNRDPELAERIRIAQNIIDRVKPGYQVTDAAEPDESGIQVIKVVPVKGHRREKVVLLKDGKPYAEQG
jgi:hypothetical protein